MNNQPKTFEEIEAELNSNLKKIRIDILDMERNIEIGKQMLESEIGKREDALKNGLDHNEDIIFKYKNDLAELETGLGIFKELETKMKQALESFHDTKKKADEYIKK